MKKQLRPYYGLVNGQETMLVSIVNFRSVYSTELRRHPILGTGYVYRYCDGKSRTHGTPAAAWLSILGIQPIATDGNKQKCAFRYNELVAVLSALKWEADDEEPGKEPGEKVSEENKQSSIPTAKAVEGEEPTDENEYISFDCFTAIAVQVIDQKLDRIMSELGVTFQLDEEKLLRAIE